MRKYSNRQQKKKRYALSTLIAGVIFLMIVFGILLVFTANGKIRRVHADETSTISAQQTRMQSMLDQVVAQADHTPAATALPEIQPTPTAIPETVASIVALDPADWKNWPILPQTISQKMIDIQPHSARLVIPTASCRHFCPVLITVKKDTLSVLIHHWKRPSSNFNGRFLVNPVLQKMERQRLIWTDITGMRTTSAGRMNRQQPVNIDSGHHRSHSLPLEPTTLLCASTFSNPICAL